MREDDVSGIKLCGVVGSLKNNVWRTIFGRRGDRQSANVLFALPRHQYIFM
jgi:hypothetical protein